MANLKTAGLVVFGLLFFGGLCYLSVVGLGKYFDSFSFDRNYLVDSTWINGVGTLTETQVGKAGSSRFEYTYEGKLYNGKSRFTFDGFRYLKGEKYMIKINPAKPDHFLPVKWAALFLKDEITAKTFAKTSRIHCDWIREFNFNI